MEKILCAAIHYHRYEFKNESYKEALPKNVSHGIVITGRRHHNCIMTWIELTGQPTRRETSTQGFLTSLNRFVDRIEANTIAINAGQVVGNTEGDQLISEDLY